jgi:hypothetical protein
MAGKALSALVRSALKAADPTTRPVRSDLTDPRWPLAQFTTPSSIPGTDAPDPVYPATSELRAAADVLVPNLRAPLITLIALCERAWSLRFQAADDYADLFDSNRAALIAGTEGARASVSPYTDDGAPFDRRQDQEETLYLASIRASLVAQVGASLETAATKLADQIVSAVDVVERAISAAEIERSIPSLGARVSADDMARVAAIKIELARVPFEGMEELWTKLTQVGDADRLDDFEAAACSILDEYVRLPPLEREWIDRGGQRGDMREGTQDRKLGVARSLRTKMLQARDAREPKDLELATTIAQKTRQVFERVLGMAWGQLPPAQFSAIVDGGAPLPKPWTIAPGWWTRGLPLTPPEGWTRLVGWQNLGASRRREQWTAAAAASDRFSGVLKRS